MLVSAWRFGVALVGCATGGVAADFARFLAISNKSSMELEGELELAHGYEVLPERPWRSLGQEVVDARRMLCGLRNKVLTTPARADPSRSISHGPSHNAQLGTHPAHDRRPDAPSGASDVPRRTANNGDTGTPRRD